MWKHSSNLKLTLGLKRINITPSLKYSLEAAKTGRLDNCPSTVKNYLFLNKEA